MGLQPADEDDAWDLQEADHSEPETEEIKAQPGLGEVVPEKEGKGRGGRGKGKGKGKGTKGRADDGTGAGAGANSKAGKVAGGRKAKAKAGPVGGLNIGDGEGTGPESQWTNVINARCTYYRTASTQINPDASLVPI